MRLYHFLPLRWAIDDLSKSRLKIASFEDLNDPFELTCYDLPTRELRAAFTKSKAELASKFGLLCFSRNWRNPLLWSHYADKHKGVCLGFDVSDASTIPVDYTANRLSLEELNMQTADQFVRTKFEGWQYEEEVRILPRLEHKNPETGLYYLDFHEGVELKEIIAGPLCVETAAIKSAIPAHQAARIALTKARLAFRSYDVVTDQRGWPE